MSERAKGRWKALAWTVAGGALLALVNWLGAAAWAEAGFERSLRWRVPRVERKVESLEKIHEQQDAQLVDLLRELKDRLDQDSKERQAAQKGKK